MFNFIKKILSHSSNNNQNEIDGKLDKVVSILSLTGYSMTEKRFGEAFTSILSGYSPAETALHIFSVATANDVVDNWDNPLFSVSGLDHATKVLLTLKPFLESGDIRPELWENDTTAISQMLNPSPHQREWVETVLKGSLAKGERVAFRS